MNRTFLKLITSMIIIIINCRVFYAFIDVVHDSAHKDWQNI